jgi:hypothetical protein
VGPKVSFFSAFVNLAGVAVSAYGANKAGKAQASATRANSELAQNAAEANALTVEANANIDIASLRAQKTQEQIAAQRQRQDLAAERGQRLGATAASLAAQGADLSSGTGLAILQSQAGRYAVRSERIAQDLYTIRKSLTKRAEDTKVVSAKHAADIRANAEFASQIAINQASAQRTAGNLNTAGQIIRGTDWPTILQDSF